jgi:hypothetical protein
VNSVAPFLVLNFRSSKKPKEPKEKLNASIQKDEALHTFFTLARLSKTFGF